MREDSARPGLAGTRFDDIRWFAQVGSTNTVAAELARSGAREGLVVVAEHQTAGRGRHGRRWEAEPGSSLLMSLLLRPPLPPTEAPLVTVLVAVAACAACEEVAGVAPALKWPNDLIVGERKLGGILGEVVPGVAMVLGLGLNVTGPVSSPEGRVALEEVTGRPVDRWDLLVALLRHLDAGCGALGSGAGRARLLAAYRARSSTLGRTVRVELAGGGSLVGEAVDITAEGHLLVEEGGTRRVVPAGDVVHLRDREMSPAAGRRPGEQPR
jgi:BirA family biotin operon repressor/biotin-[acetyl-CoA-carboxylase] ligase